MNNALDTLKIPLIVFAYGNLNFESDCLRFVKRVKNVMVETIEDTCYERETRRNGRKGRRKGEDDNRL